MIDPDNAFLMWGVFIALVPILLIADLFIFNRNDHVIELRESLKMSAYYIGIGLLFGGFVYWNMGAEHAIDYYTAFILEKSLSLDNLFVISVIFTAFAIPKEFQHRVLIWGIIGVIILRGIMIGAGTAIVHQFEWVLLIFAAFLVFTGIKMLLMKDHDDEENSFENKPLVQFLRKHMNFTSQLHGHNFWVRLPSKNDPSKTRLFATPLLLALIIVELTDVMFAFDSIPAVLAVTTEPYIVYTSNIFAILGLRALFFAVESIITRFVLMKYALSIVLIFIGAKVFCNEFLFHIPAVVSLCITLFVLLGGMIFSIIITANKEKEGA